ncbi:MAG: diacylglycerol kinase [Gammaproteobacteria bacterium TMED107]|nr:diacylglycerol kinase [Gammaproteobacteria bacterium]OUX76754.1 MAG: diacylglycerol kinase [Gammaproteobacteria bacterium TMED107]
MSLPDRKTGFSRILAATRYSLSGLGLAARTEEAFKQECFLFMLLAPIGLWLGETQVEKILLVGALVAVLIVELLNTAVEAAVDRVSAEFHELSRQAKDLGSAAVFLSLGYVIFTWVVILLF